MSDDYPLAQASVDVSAWAQAETSYGRTSVAALAGCDRLCRQCRRAEQAIEELLKGHDLDHLISYRLHLNQVVIGFRLLARNLAIGWQIDQV